MKLSDYKVEDGLYQLPGDEGGYPDVTELLQSGMLKFCACGRPEENLTYILGGLELIAEERPDDIDHSMWFVGHEERARKHFGNQEAEYFFYYWADSEGYIEHGGGVPGWLTHEGENLLALLREWQGRD